MPAVHLPSTLRQRAGGISPLAAPGATAGEVLRNLEKVSPALAGWILDEKGAMRQHVHVFVNDEQADLRRAVSERDEITIVQAISGGAPEAP
jgi:molybdopterin converting factor small subunit